MSRESRRLPLRALLGISAVLIVGCALVLRALLGFGLTTAGVEATARAPDALWDDLDAVLTAHVGRDGQVDYTGLTADSGALREIAAGLAVVGPRMTPEHFRTDEDRLAYYINAYNVLTLLGVVAHWPITSVHDVRGAINPKDGFGFFYAQRFQLDGRRVSLYTLENSWIRGSFVDARFHAAINCASASCPSLAPVAYRSETLDIALSAAAQMFAALKPHVEVDREASVVRLSQIYSWYAEDFEAQAAALGVPPTVLWWIDAQSGMEDGEEIAEAGFSVEYVPYDWSLNGR